VSCDRRQQRTGLQNRRDRSPILQRQHAPRHPRPTTDQAPLTRDVAATLRHRRLHSELDSSSYQYWSSNVSRANAEHAGREAFQASLLQFPPAVESRDHSLGQMEASTNTVVSIGVVPTPRWAWMQRTRLPLKIISVETELTTVPSYGSRVSEPLSRVHFHSSAAVQRDLARAPDVGR